MEHQTLNLISENSVIKGDLVITDKTIIHGSVEGNIFSEIQNDLFIEHEAKIKGNIKAITVHIKGKVEGEVNASDSVFIYAGSVVNGRINSKNMILYPGAVVNSHIDVE